MRLTGGEPLVRGDILGICRGIAAIDGIGALCLTTNASRLAPLAQDLKAAGVDGVNLSVDSLRPERYRAITRCGRLEDALDGLCAALDAGFDRVKVNMVLMGGRERRRD